jgi:hypothetical protein
MIEIKTIEMIDNNIDVLTKWLRMCQQGNKCKACDIQRDCMILRMELGIKGVV